MLDKNFYIYRHIRPDKNEVFYIGKGSLLSKGHSFRPEEKRRRSEWWRKVVEKNNGEYIIQIIYGCDTEEEVNSKEIEFIKLYGRKDLGKGTLVNMTNGGDGSLGIKVSDITRKKLSDINKGEKHFNYGKKLSKETCLKKSESMKSSPKNLKGKKLPEWWREKIRQTKVGSMNPMFGKISPRARMVIDSRTGIEYGSIMEAAKFTPYQFQYVSAMLNGTKPNKTTLKFKDGM
jgi:hypothetical protein